MIQSRRRLPHWVPDGVPVFVTWRLAGTLPHGFAKKSEQHHRPGERFAAADGELDRATSGPLWLRERRVAGMLSDALQYGASAKGWYQLHAYVIMPNHVHVIWTPNVAMPRILQWLKGVTAKRAKRLLNLGEIKAFWQDESYDHWIRSDREMQKIIRYVEWNPVKAGLAKSVEEWPWSSAYRAE
jgi:REP element-mobilizing transposase RayT